MGAHCSCGKLLPTSTLDTYKCWSTLICCPWAFSSSLKQVYPCEGDSLGTTGGGGCVHKVLASA